MMFLLCGALCYAQTDSIAVAEKYHASGDFNRAKIAIDAAAKNPATKNNAYTWYLRSFIYKDIYKTQEKTNKKSPSRTESIISSKRSIELGKNKGEIADLKQIVKFISASFYNDYVGILDQNNYEDAITNFTLFKENMQFADSNYNFTPKTIEFKMALATIYEKIFNADQKKNKLFFDKAEALYKEVLQLDANNITANYNLAMLYYNYSVSTINSMNSETDIVELMSLQDGCIDLFKKSLPYMLKAYELNPKRIETLKGLQGIYFSLSEVEKSDEIKKQIQALEK